MKIKHEKVFKVRYHSTKETIPPVSMDSIYIAFNRTDIVKQSRIDAEVAILGDGDLIINASVVVEGSKIIYVGETEHAPSVDNSIQVPVITPGFWDCHGHYFGLKQASLERSFQRVISMITMQNIRVSRVSF